MVSNFRADLKCANITGIELPVTAKLSAENEPPPIANVLLAAGLLPDLQFVIARDYN